VSLVEVNRRDKEIQRWRHLQAEREQEEAYRQQVLTTVNNNRGHYR